jgi:hypothetical protein
VVKKFDLHQSHKDDVAYGDGAIGMDEDAPHVTLVVVMKKSANSLVEVADPVQSALWERNHYCRSCLTRPLITYGWSKSICKKVVTHVVPIVHVCKLVGPKG